MDTAGTVDAEQLKGIMTNVKRLAIAYRCLTGRPLGITGEVAECMPRSPVHNHQPYPRTRRRAVTAGWVGAAETGGG
jgi:hypothetical protein